MPLDCKASLVWKQTVEKRERRNHRTIIKKSTLVHKLDLETFMAFNNSGACLGTTNTVKVLQMTGEILGRPKTRHFSPYVLTVLVNC